MKCFGLITVLSLLGVVKSVLADPTPSLAYKVRLATAILEPYQVYDKTGNLSGSGVEAMQCIEKESGLNFIIDVFPWKRAQELVASGEYDGFFVGSQNDSRDKYAKYVGPLLHSFWHWYLPPSKDTHLDDEGLPTNKNAEIGVVLGTNMYQWVSGLSGYKVVSHTDSTTLFELLVAGRLDYVLATGAMYEEFLNTTTHKPEEIDLNVLVARSKPLGLYLGHKLLVREANIAAKIEKSAARCAP